MKKPVLIKIYFTFYFGLALGFIQANNNLSFERIDNRHGLSSDFVTNSIQDRDGFIWFTTYDGLNRFDGYTIKNYKTRVDGTGYFNSNNFKCIEQDQDGNLWLGTLQNGINIFNPKTEEVAIVSTDTSNNLSIHDNQIQDIHCDKKGRVWIATYHGICLYDPQKGHIKVYDSGSVPENNVTSIYEDSFGRIFFGSWSYGLYLYDEIKDSFKNFQVNIPDATDIKVWCIQEDGHKNIWIGTWDTGLLKTRVTEGSVIVLEHYHIEAQEGNQLCDNLIFSLEYTQGNGLWVGTSQGLNILQNVNTPGQHIQTILEGRKNNQVSVAEVYSLMQDASGSVWLATIGGGVNKVDLNKYNFEQFNIPDEGLPFRSQIVNAIYPLNEDELILGVRSLGLGLYNTKEKTFQHFLDAPFFKGIDPEINTAYCIFMDSYKNLWVGTRYFGLFVKKASNGQWENVVPRNYFSTGMPYSIKCMIEDKYKCLWVGTSEGLIKLVKKEGLSGYDIYSFTPQSNNPFSLGGRNITRLLIDSNETLWIVTQDGGISRLANDLKEHYPLSFNSDKHTTRNNSTLGNNNINTIIEDREGRIWVGTSTSGILQYNKSTHSYIHYKNILNIIGNTVYDIILDSSGAMWLTTNHGLVRLVIDGTEANIQNFTYEDGLQGNIFNRGAIATDSRGHIYIGGMYGFNRFNPGSFKINTTIPPVVITGIQVNNKPVETGRVKNNKLTLTHKENNLSAQFSALSYSQSKKNKFSYFLEGFDKEWIMADHRNRNAVYTNIPPGKYTLHVKAANNSWIWNPTPASLHIIVKPSPFLSSTAIAIYIVLSLGLFYLFYWFKLNNVKIRQAYEIEKIERKKEENIHQFKLRFFTNISHELLTPLSVISCSVEEFLGKKEFNRASLLSVSRNVNRLMNLINQLLDFRKIETGKMKLNVSLCNLDNAFQKLNELYFPLAKNKNILFQVVGNIGCQVYADEEKIMTILSNLTSNAFKYSLQDGEVVVSYSLTGKKPQQYLEFSVVDSGVGIDEKEKQHIFDRFYQVDSVTGKTFGAGIGLSLAKNLATLHKGQISVLSEKDKGTTFKVKIPVFRDAYSSDELANASKDEHTPESTVKITDAPLSFALDKSPATNPNQKNFKVLVVEDHPEFRALLCNHLAAFYTTYEAPDGQEGYNMASKIHPDLIVSDVMMPNMDGLELCQKIKENVEHNHIMVILLTAKVTNQDRYEGYLHGADSYLPKPIDFKLLIARIESLRKQREVAKQKYADGFTFGSHPEGVSPLNQKFIDQLINIIKEQLSNPALNVSMLLENIPLSHSTLYRKTQSITGMSPNEFIRHIRIKEAAKLLLQRSMNISEVAYSVGFNDQSYFSRCFKKQFHKTPKQFIKEH